MEQTKLPAMGHRKFATEERLYLKKVGFHVNLPNVASRRAPRVMWGQYVRHGRIYGTWVSTLGDGMGVREWQSPDFDDPISAFVYAELNNWGQ